MRAIRKVVDITKKLLTPSAKKNLGQNLVEFVEGDEGLSNSCQLDDVRDVQGWRKNHKENCRK